MKNQQTIAGELLGMEARRAAFLLINEKIARQSDREWWRELIAEQKAAYNARQEQLKESREK